MDNLNEQPLEGGVEDELVSPDVERQRQGVPEALEEDARTGRGQTTQEQLENELELTTDTTRAAGGTGEISLSVTLGGDAAGTTQFLEVGDLDDGATFERDLQQWLALKEKEVRQMAAQLAEVEARRQQRADEFSVEIELLKQQHSEEIENALAASVQAREELRDCKIKHGGEIERALAECESRHREELQALRTQLEGRTDVEVGERGSLIPRLSPQLSSGAQKELRLQRERLQRQHRSELKVQEQKLRGDLALESDARQSRLEEEFMAKLAEVVTESVLKNAAQVEQISLQLREEKKRALSQLEAEEGERHRQEVARLTEERREAIEACKAEMEIARNDFQARIVALNESLASERERQTELVQGRKEQEEWGEREERLRGEMETEFQRRVEEVRRECGREKEVALETLRQALEEGLQTELKRAHELHRQALAEHQAAFEERLSTAQEKIQTLQSELQRVGQQEEGRIREEVRVQEGVRVQEERARVAKEQFEEMSEKIQSVHRAELVALESDREAERGRQVEEMERVREEMEARLHHELEQLTGSHKAEVGRLQQQYQAQLDSLTLSHQQTMEEVRQSVVKDLRISVEEQYRFQVEQLQSDHTSQLKEVEEKLQRARENRNVISTQLQSVKVELSEVQRVVEEQRGVLRQTEEEREQLSRQVQVAGAREREREEQRERQLREDTASLAILQKQLTALSSEKEALQSSLVMLQSSVSGCLQLASLVEQTLSPPPPHNNHLWNTPSALTGVDGSSGVREEGEPKEDTLTPPAGQSTGGPVGVASSAGSAVWNKSAPNLLSSGSLWRQTPSDDSGLASQQASVVNSEATPVVTPMAEGSESATPVSQVSPAGPHPPQPPQPPNLTILPLDDTAASLQDVSQAPGLSYDQSQMGMLSVSFLDATHHSSHPHPLPSHPHPPPPHAQQAGDLDISTMDQALLPLNLSQLPAVQEGLSHLQDTVSALLQRYITVAAEAADYRQKLVTFTTDASEALSSQETLRQRVCELEREARPREQRLADSEQHMTTAQDNLQRVVSESEEARAEAECLRQQLSAVQEALSTAEQRQREAESLLGEKREETEAQRRTLESVEAQGQLRIQMLDSQIGQLQEELGAAQRNCAGAVHEKEAMHQENKRLGGVQVALEGQLHQLVEETAARQRDLESRLKQREDEIRELQAVKAEISSHRETQEALRAERDELRQRLGSVEHQLALSQAVSAEEQVSRLQELTAREAQLTSDLRQQTATCQALQERVRVAHESLNQTTQENLSVRMSQAQLEGEVNRLREELQRRETALHRAQTQSASQARQLSGALDQLALLQATIREEGEGEGEEEGDKSENEDAPLPEESSHEVVSKLQQELLQQREICGSLETQIILLTDTLTSKDGELEALRLARSHQDLALQQARAQLETRGTADEEDRAKGELQTARKGEEALQELNSSSTHSLLSTTSTMVGLEESGSRSILRRIADLAPALSRDAHTVNQLSKNFQLPVLSVEQLTAAVNSLSQMVGVLSQRGGGGGADGEGEGEDVIGVLEAVQRLVEELTVVLSSLDHGNTTQLPQQLSAVSDLLSQLVAADREALVRDTTSLRQTVASLQTQLHQQSEGVSAQVQQVFEENEQLRIKLRDAELHVHQQSEVSTQQRASLEAVSCRAAQLERELRQQTEGTRHVHQAEGGRLRLRLEDCERELERLRGEGRRTEEVGREREAELGRVQALLQSLETDNREQGEHYSQLLESERRMVASLRSSLQAKERELTEAVDRLLQEKVGLARAQGELASLTTRCETDQQHISSLQTKLSSLRAVGESRAGDETARQLELDHLRRQLQASSEQQRGAASEAAQEKQRLKATVSRLEAQLTSLQRKSSRDKEEVGQLHEVLAGKEEEVARLQQQLASLDDITPPLSTMPQDLLQAKLMRLYAKYREAEVHRKALVFQKNYLKCQVDAFFQTQQAALIMMAEMGAPPAHTHKSRSLQNRFKVAAHVVMATYRFQYVVRRKNQYIRSYSSRVEREKAAALAGGLGCDDIGRATGVDGILSSYQSTSHQPSPGMTSAFPPPTTTTISGRIGTKSSAKPLHSHTSIQPTTSQPHLSTFIPSLARLQAKLNGASH